jgi:hypothetical protein
MTQSAHRITAAEDAPSGEGVGRRSWSARACATKGSAAAASSTGFMAEEGSASCSACACAKSGFVVGSDSVSASHPSWLCAESRMTQHVARADATAAKPGVHNRQ